MRVPAEKAAQLLAALLRDVGIDDSDALIDEAMPQYDFNGFIGMSWFLRDEMIRQAGESKAPCLSSTCYKKLAQAYIDAILKEYPRVLCLPDHPAKFLWRYLDESLVVRALETIRQRYSEDIGIRTLYTAAALSHWTGGEADGYGYSHSAKEKYEPIFDSPTLEDVKKFCKTARFNVLPDDVRVRTASLYLLLRDGEFDQATGDRQVTRARALDLLADWQV